jgi:hypothetical protein
MWFSTFDNSQDKIKNFELVSMLSADIAFERRYSTQYSVA